jgi:biotin synthase
VELVELLRRLGVEGLPISFLEPQPGTPLSRRPLLDPDEALRVVALHRVMIPAADVIVTGGRDLVLGDRNERLLEAGANGLMVGDYVTSLGGEVERDHALIEAAGCRPRPPAARP